MKKKISIFLSLLLVVIWMAAPAEAAGKKLYDIESNKVDKLILRFGGNGDVRTLNADQDAALIDEIIKSLNDFEYEGIEEREPFVGWYVMIDIFNKDGTSQEIEVGPSCVYIPTDVPGGRTAYFSTIPDYFGEEWVRMLFDKKLLCFEDIDMWAESYIEAVYQDGLMLGTSKTHFSPNETMTRGMFVTVLGRMANVDEEEYTSAVFEDVKTDDYYAAYVTWATENGIVNGTSAKTFSPNEFVTREQAVLLISRYVEKYKLTLPNNNKEAPNFLDIQNTSNEFQEKYPALYAASIISGKTKNSFDPIGKLTRAEAAKIFATTKNVLQEN